MQLASFIFLLRKEKLGGYEINHGNEVWRGMGRAISKNLFMRTILAL